MIERSECGAIVITGRSIALYRLATIVRGLKLEVQGLRLTRGRTCYAIAKSEFGLKGNKQRVLEQMLEVYETAKAAHLDSGKGEMPA